MPNYDRNLDPPEYEPTLCPCGRTIDEQSLYEGHDTCTRCRTEDVYCSRCGESLTREDLTEGDGLCGLCRAREAQIKEASA